MEEYSEEVKTCVSKNSWENLSRIVLTTVILFNRRRSGEAERLEVETYLNHDKTACQAEIEKSLTNLEKQLVNNLTLIETSGKRGRKVPIILREDMRNGIELLIKHRSDVGVFKDNKYIFARTNFNSLNCQRASESIKKSAIDAGLKEPNLITSTKLRKHIATMSQLFNLKENELDSLANFMGHDIKIHREFYRLPEKTMMLAKISKLLLAAEKGKLHIYKGKSLDDINEEEISDGIDSDESTMSSPEPEDNSNLHIPDDHEEMLPDDPTPIKRKKAKKANVRKQTGNLKKTTKMPWTEEESKAVKLHMSKHFLLKKLPGKKECVQCIEKSGSILNRRTWRQIKYFVYNRI